jgi:hypothetical protein
VSEGVVGLFTKFGTVDVAGDNNTSGNGGTQFTNLSHQGRKIAVT